MFKRKDKEPSIPQPMGNDVPMEARADLDAIGEFAFEHVIPPAPLYGRFHLNRTAAQRQAEATARAALTRCVKHIQQQAALIDAIPQREAFHQHIRRSLEKRREQH